MLHNYVKIAFRNLAKNKFFSILNIGGLALGMSACLTVILIIRDQLSYDNFHPLSDRIYRINCQQDEGSKLASTPEPLGETLLRQYSVAAQQVTLVRGLYGVDAVTADHQSHPVGGYYTGSAFFEVFGFQLKAGNPANALDDPYSMVLSEKAADRIFGSANPVGQTLTLGDRGNFTVTGVVATPPGKSHIDFDCLLSVGALKAIEAKFTPEQYEERTIGNWKNHYMAHTYLLLQPDKSRKDLDAVLQAVGEQRRKDDPSDKAAHVFFSQPLGKISPKPENYANEMGGGAPMFFIWGMGVFVLLLMIFPCINYASMTISKSLARAREVGVRKVVGARMADVQQLMLTEAVVTSMLALVVAWALHLPQLYFVKQYFPAGAKLDNLHAGMTDWIVFVVFGVLVGILSGWLPARQLAKTDAAIALKGAAPVTRAGRFSQWGRTALLVGQFAFSLIFMIVVFTLWSQMRYMTQADYGFNKENLLVIEMQGNKTDILAAELAQSPKVTGLSSASVLLASNNLQGMPMKKEKGGEDLGTDCTFADEHYLDVMHLELLAGEPFQAHTPNDRAYQIIVNETLINRFQLGTPQEAIGKMLWVNDTITATIKGVVKDFHYRILEHSIGAFSIVYAPTSSNHLLYARIAPGNPAVAMAELESIWKKTDAVHPFKATFMEESVQKAYTHVTFVGGLASFFSLLALSLACIGLLGMVTYSVSTRVKEIGVRKVLGATLAQITIQLSQRFLWLLAIALAVALPVGYLLANLFLNLFAYRIGVGVLIIGGSASLLLLLALSTIGVQAMRAALANPVQSLRNE